eukprot:4392707-Prymnesium_polylepis.1
MPSAWHCRCVGLGLGSGIGSGVRFGLGAGVGDPLRAGCHPSSLARMFGPDMTAPNMAAPKMASAHPSSLARMFGAKPPSSPTLHASWPYFFLMTDLRWW